MQFNEANKKVKDWIKQLVGQELKYISGNKFVTIKEIDDQDGGKITVTRGVGEVTIRYNRIENVLGELLQGSPIHIDTIMHSSGNDRSIIEAILANLPPIGYMKGNTGRNKNKNKVIQWLKEDIHSPGEIKDVSDEVYKDLTLNSAMTVHKKLLYKPFLLLAGISGTGKTKFVRDQARATGALRETYCLTAVRPDWHEPSDLLGYISRLNGHPEYITTDILQFIAKAWREIIDCGLIPKVAESDQQGEYLVVEGHHDKLLSVRPYWLCLDEMNLAPIEQYFADYLSVLETRNWDWNRNEDTFMYSCDPLLKAETIQQINDKQQLRNSLGLGQETYANVWEHFCNHGLSIPFNLIVAGTVNMDETTHGFSRKVIDRALSFDFGEFFPNDYEHFFKPNVKNNLLSYPIWSQAQREDLSGTCDSNGEKSIQFLNSVNNVLSNTPYKLAYRALNELLLAVISQRPKNELELKAVWDDFLMCKVLPRIEGDYDKLGTAPSILEELLVLLQVQFTEFWNEPAESQYARIDLYRKYQSEENITIKCRSKEKLEWMQHRLSSVGFTSFWP